MPRCAWGHPVRGRRLPVRRRWVRRRPRVRVCSLHPFRCSGDAKQNSKSSEFAHGFVIEMQLSGLFLGALVALLHAGSHLATPLREPVGAPPAVVDPDRARGACVPVDGAAMMAWEQRRGIMRLRGGGPKKAPKSGKQAQAKVKPALLAARAGVRRRRANAARAARGVRRRRGGGMTTCA